jgi:hypothetical protein
MNSLMKCVIFIVAMLLTSCAAFKVSPEEEAAREKAHKVAVLDSMREADLLEFEEVVKLECVRSKNSIGSPLESCRQEFKMGAAEKGGELCVIQGQEVKKCQYGTDDCVYLKATCHKKMATALE